MQHSPFYLQASRARQAGGFTLVELLVVIGIIAILAGVALGPITGGLRKAKQNVGMQDARTLALAEFQYSIDNDAYPDKAGGTAADIAKLLLNGNYISDPGLFWLSGSANEPSKYTGTNAATSIDIKNISYDFAGTTSGAGLNTNTPDQMPVVWSCSGGDPGFTAVGVVAKKATSQLPFGLQGSAVCFKSNSAKFIIATVDGGTATVNYTDAGYPGYPSYEYREGGG